MAIPENVIFTDNTAERLRQFIASASFDKIGFLVDENTKKHCLPRLSSITDDLTVEIRSGEEHKTLTTCLHIWKQLTEGGFTRKSLLVNLGGGVITDMGGFAAATYKRGIAFVNIPTTLLAQVDASIGGKLGVDFDGLKNHIGLFREPNLVIADAGFLDTLGEREMKSGFAEIIKHALITHAAYWKEISSLPLEDIRNWQDIIGKSVEIKGSVVHKDPHEQGLRKILNFGHTLGHAIETYYLHTPEKLLHGEAIAIGMILEAFLSVEKCGLPASEREEIARYLRAAFHWHPLPEAGQITALLEQDKKTDATGVNYSLLSRIGICRWDQNVSAEMIEKAIEYYHKLYE